MRAKQSGKLSIEQIGWIVVALLLLIAGGTTASNVLNGKTSVITRTLQKNTLLCPPNSIGVDIRAYAPNGMPIVDTPIDGTLDVQVVVPGYGTTISKSPYVDLDGGKDLTFELACFPAPNGW